MTLSDLEKMCRGYGLRTRLARSGEGLCYQLVPQGRHLPLCPSLGSVTTTELYEMSASELEDLVVECSVRSMEGLCYSGGVVVDDDPARG
jgi:hypothetical protein